MDERRTQMQMPSASGSAYCADGRAEVRVIEAMNKMSLVRLCEKSYERKTSRLGSRPLMFCPAVTCTECFFD